MEKYGIDVQVLTQTTPVLLGFNASEAAEICRMSNDDNFELCKAHPKKFVNVCMLSLLDMKSAMEELAGVLRSWTAAVSPFQPTRTERGWTLPSSTPSTR